MKPGITITIAILLAIIVLLLAALARQPGTASVPSTNVPSANVPSANIATATDTDTRKNNTQAPEPSSSSGEPAIALACGKKKQLQIVIKNGLASIFEYNKPILLHQPYTQTEGTTQITGKLTLFDFEVMLKQNKELTLVLIKGDDKKVRKDTCEPMAIPRG